MWRKPRAPHAILPPCTTKHRRMAMGISSTTQPWLQQHVVSTNAQTSSALPFGSQSQILADTLPHMPFSTPLTPQSVVSCLTSIPDFT